MDQQRVILGNRVDRRTQPPTAPIPFLPPHKPLTTPSPCFNLSFENPHLWFGVLRGQGDLAGPGRENLGRKSGQNHGSLWLLSRGGTGKGGREGRRGCLWLLACPHSCHIQTDAIVIIQTTRRRPDFFLFPRLSATHLFPCSFSLATIVLCPRRSAPSLYKTPDSDKDYRWIYSSWGPYYIISTRGRWQGTKMSLIRV